jgi:hypothetical protein
MPTVTPEDLAPGWEYSTTRSSGLYAVWTNPAHYGSEISVSTSLAQPGYWVHQHGEFVGRYTTREQAIEVIETGKRY